MKHPNGYDADVSQRSVSDNAMLKALVVRVQIFKAGRAGATLGRRNLTYRVESAIGKPQQRRLLLFEDRFLIWTGRFEKKHDLWALTSDDGREWNSKTHLEVKELEDFVITFFELERRTRKLSHTAEWHVPALQPDLFALGV